MDVLLPEEKLSQQSSKDESGKMLLAPSWVFKKIIRTAVLAYVYSQCDLGFMSLCPKLQVQHSLEISLNSIALIFLSFL